METVELILEPNTEAVDIVSGINARTGDAYELEQDVQHVIENIGSFRAEMLASENAPSIPTRRGRKLLPRGIMSIRHFTPADDIPIWAWNPEGIKTVVTIDLAP